MGPHALEQRLRQLEAIHRSLGEQIAALRLMQKEYGLGTFYGTIEIPTPYGKVDKTDTGDPAPYSLSAAAAQPELQAEAPAKPAEPSGEIPAKRKPAKEKRAEVPTMSLDEAKRVVLDGYVLDHPGNADRLLKTLVYRLLDGSVKGFKSVDLPAARIVARSMLEHSGIRSSGQGFNDMRLRGLMRKYVPFEPITSIRRLPR
jgi:hypothetical protein